MINKNRYLQIVFILFCMCSFSVIFVGQPVAEAEEAQPKIMFDNTSLKYDFGRVAQFSKTKKVITFRNVGMADLKIEKIRPVCGCTATILTRDVLKPGEIGEIEVTFDAMRYHGYINKRIDVYTNDPGNSHIELVLLAHVDVEFDIEPLIINFGQISLRDYGITRFATIHARDQENLEIVSIEKEGDFFDAEVVKPEKKDENYQLSISLNKNIKVGALRGKVTLHSNNAKVPEVSIDVAVYVKGHLKLKPRNGSFRIGSKSDPVQQVVYVEDTGNPDFMITDIVLVPSETLDTDSADKKTAPLEITQKDFKFNIEPVANKKGAIKITITFLKELEYGQRITGRLLIKTNEKSEPELQYQYHAFRPSAQLVDPLNLYFKISNDNLHPQKEVTIRNLENKNFKVLKAEIDVSNPVNKEKSGKGFTRKFVPATKDDLTIDFKAGEVKGVVKVIVTFNRNLQPNEQVRGKIIFTTNDDSFKEVTVNYYGLFLGHKPSTMY